MSTNLTDPLINNSNAGNPNQSSDAPKPRDPVKKASRLSSRTARQIQMFLHGGESSIITEQGDYNIHRMLPQYVKYYLNWTRDTFPSIVRLSWTSLMTLFITMKLLTIAFFAIIMKWMDGHHERECVTNASTYSDFFYFVVHTIFTIGYGSMSPVCHWSNIMVTVISFFGMFQTATFTGVFFAKFSMDPRRNFACAFTTKLVGVPPLGFAEQESPSGMGMDEMVRFNFRFVNVFHSRYFKVSCRMFLIEHRLNTVTEHWLTPAVEELRYFDTSAPLEFMSLPVEVCAYVPFSRLVRTSPSGHVSPFVSPSASPGLRIEGLHPHHRGPLGHRHEWVRHFSSHYKQHVRYSHQPVDVGEPATPRIHSTLLESREDIPISSEFEMVCMLVFTDATTGCEIAVRKSWPLADTIWLGQTEQRVRWRDIIHRDEKSDKYLVDVTGLDFIDNSVESLLPQVPEGVSQLERPGAMRGPSNTMAYQLINQMTMTTRHGQHTHATGLFPTIPEEKV